MCVFNLDYFEAFAKIDKDFENLKKQDRIKEKYCKNKNIPLLIIPYTKINKIEQIINKFLLSTN